jgi:hypothetical protein
MGFGGISIFGLAVLLVPLILVFILAKNKGRPALLWIVITVGCFIPYIIGFLSGILGLIFPFVPLVILILLPNTKTQKGPMKIAQVEKFVKKLVNKKSGKAVVSLELVADALNINAGNYISNFTPDNNLLANITFGSMAGGASGAAYTAASFVQGAVSSYKAAKIDMGSRYSGFIIADKDIVTLNGLAQMLAKGIINKQEFMKGAASLAYNSGQGLCNLAEVDAFGSLNFKNDEDRYIAAICYQFFAENTVDKARIEALYNENKSLLAAEDSGTSIRVR